MKKILKDGTTEEKLKQVDILLTRMSRRLHKKTVVIVPPYPVSACLTGEDISGEVLRFMFPGDGKITSGLIVVESAKRTTVNVDISIEDDLGGTAKSFIVDKKKLTISPNLDVKFGNRLIITATPQDRENVKVTSVWVAFLWVPGIKDASVRDFLIDDLEKSSNDILIE